MWTMDTIIETDQLTRTSPTDQTGVKGAPIMACKLCTVDPTYRDRERICGFTEIRTTADDGRPRVVGMFNSHNWHCATLDLLMQFAGGAVRELHQDGALHILTADPKVDGGWVLLLTHPAGRPIITAAVHLSGTTMHRLTLSVAESLVEFLRRTGNNA